MRAERDTGSEVSTSFARALVRSAFLDRPVAGAPDRALQRLGIPPRAGTGKTMRAMVVGAALVALFAVQSRAACPPSVEESAPVAYGAEVECREGELSVSTGDAWCRVAAGAVGGSSSGPSGRDGSGG